MTLHRNITGAPGPIVERADRSALAGDYRRILMRLHQCEAAIRHIDSAAMQAGSIRLTGDGDVADLMIDAGNLLDDAKSQIRAAMAMLDASITPEMDKTQ
jgi:hypothetical protein